jgi:drug/metabolite transporter (DMT)-like permease
MAHLFRLSANGLGLIAWPWSRMRLLASVAFALIAFAANSLLCRVALGRGVIDAASFTFIRLASGAIVLLALNLFRAPRPKNLFRCNGLSASALFIYAAAFSLAYRQLPAAAGALLLFGSVQLTMVSSALMRGERPRTAEWLGLMLAFAGLVYLVSPGLSAPPALAAALMIVAGIAWGLYTLQGRRQGDPLATTAANFLWSVPLAALFWITQPPFSNTSAAGVTWAVVSGAVTSGLGYAVWYTALPAVTATRAATVQLMVPVIAAFGAVAFLDEAITRRLVVASVLVLGGVGWAILARRRPRAQN